MAENGNGNDWYRGKIKALEFARMLKRNVGKPDARYVLFLGAGCSVSSGIPSAGRLVYKWLRELTGDLSTVDEDVLAYGEKVINGFDKKNPAASYGEVFNKIYPEPALRQAEIEGICAKAHPKLGYVVLGRLMTHEEFGPSFNFALTTNFDDIISESIYLYTKSKPRGFVHESLFEHMRVNSPMPTIVKLHGDAHIDTRNIPKETKEFSGEVKAVITNVMHQKGLIFIGYGGNDQSVADFLKELPRSSFPWGIFWVGNKPPGERLLEAFEKLGEVTWVEHRDFDLLMLYIRNVFEIELPEEDEYSERFHIFKDSYFETLKEIEEIRRKTDDVEEQKEIEDAVQEGAKQYDDWWAVELEAQKYKETDADKADEIYRDGLKQFPDSHQLMNSYAVFLENIRKDYDTAEEYYKRAIKADPNHANALGNYANFLTDIRKDNDAAEEYYKWAIEADPMYASNLGNYAIFLKDIRKDYDKAEEYYKRAIEAAPEHANNLGTYANFLWKTREDNEAAEKYYKRAFEVDPDSPIKLGNYAGFLFARGRLEEGFEHLTKSDEFVTKEPQILENNFYRYAHTGDEKERVEALRLINELIASGVRSPYFNLSKNVARAIEDGHPEPDFLAVLAKVIADEADASELDKFEAWKNA